MAVWVGITGDVYKAGLAGAKVVGYTATVTVKIQREDGTYLRGSESAGERLDGPDYYNHVVQWVGIPPKGTFEVVSGRATVIT